MNFALAEPVTVSVEGGDRGRGLALMRGEECYILTPAHVVRFAHDKPNTKIKVTGSDGAQGVAILSANVGADADDIALLRLTNNADRICSDQINSEITQKQGANLVLREEHGGLTFIPVDIRSLDKRTLGISSKSEGKIKSMMSGSLLIEDGETKGLLISVPTEIDQPAEVRSLGYLAGLLGAWVKKGVNDITKVNNALSIIEKAIKMKPLGDIGQIAAIEQLVREGATFSGMELQRISFKGATINHVNFAEAHLESSGFEGATLLNSILDKAHLDFSNLEKIELAGSSLKGTYLYFVDALGANFQNIKAAESNWAGASLRGASFKGADLRNSSFAYADLRGADFTGANLSGAFFIGTIVMDAKFEGAIILNTDFTSSIGKSDIFSAAQKNELCSTQIEGYFRFELINIIPSSELSGGTKYYSEYKNTAGFPDDLPFLEKCKLRTVLPMGIYPIYEGSRERVTGEISLIYPKSFIGQNGLIKKFKNRMRDHFVMIQNAWKTNSFIAVHSESYATHLNALKPNVDSANSVEKPIPQIAIPPVTISCPNPDPNVRIETFTSTEIDQEFTLNNGTVLVVPFKSGPLGSEKKIALGKPDSGEEFAKTMIISQCPGVFNPSAYDYTSSVDICVVTGLEISFNLIAGQIRKDFPMSRYRCVLLPNQQYHLSVFQHYPGPRPPFTANTKNTCRTKECGVRVSIR